jgi:excinuclease ABC subunit C
MVRITPHAIPLTHGLAVAIRTRRANNRTVSDPSDFVMDDRLQRLNEKAKGLPKAPGVYLMKDDTGRVIYVGKSASLRDRVGSYFQPSTKLEYKKAPLRDLVCDFEVIQTHSEVEALLAENRLIKDIQPKFNARLLDDKTFPYLMITTGDEFPGVYVTREPRTEGVKLYGPFTSVWSLKEAVSHLQRAFKFRTCHLEILEEDEKRRFFRPCLLYAINQCTAPCAAKIPRDTYGEDIKRLIRFIEGDPKSTIKELEREMKNASENMQYERAARLRDEIKALQSLGNRSAARCASSTACRSRTATADTRSSTARGTTITFRSRKSSHVAIARREATTSSTRT